MGGIMSKCGRAMSMTTKDNSKKMALLIGVNYLKKVGLRQLQGCHNDVEITKQYLINYCGFLPENIIVLIDTENCDSHTEPTHLNIRTQLSNLVLSGNDVLFVHFSGHGGRQRSEAEDYDTGFDEFIYASDGKRITDDDIRNYVNEVPVGCRITIVADCCHSGGMIEAAKEQIGDSTKKRGSYSRSSFKTIQVPAEDDGYVARRKTFISPKSIMKTKEDFGPRSSSFPDGGILLSACQSYEVADEKEFSGRICGALTTVIEQTLGKVTNYELVVRAREILKMLSSKQNPGLYCSDLNAHAHYLH